MKTFNKIKAFLVLFMVLAVNTASAGTATLMATWEHSPSPQATGYRVMYGTASGQYNASFDVGYVKSVIIPDLEPSKEYFIVLKAFDAAGNFSVPSNEASAVTKAVVANPLLPPTNIYVSP